MIPNNLRDEYLEGMVKFENPSYDNAIIGFTTSDRIVYDYDLMIDHLIENEGMTEMEAIEFIEYNTIRAIPFFEKSPIIITLFGDEE